MTKKIKIALLDTGVDLRHPVFGGVDISETSFPQFVYHDKGLERSLYEPKQGHGTAVASILVKNARHCSITSFVLFEDALSNGAVAPVPVSRYIAVLDAILHSGERFDIIHMSLGVRQYSRELEELCAAFKERSVIVSALDNVGYVSYPAAFAGVIGVAAMSEKH
jgi:subtilisin family serine protease